MYTFWKTMKKFEVWKLENYIFLLTLFYTGGVQRTPPGGISHVTPQWTLRLSSYFMTLFLSTFVTSHWGHFSKKNFENFTKFGTLSQQENSSSTLTPTTIIVKTSVFPIILINQIEINAAPAPVVICPRGLSLDQLNLRWVLEMMLVTWCPRGALFCQPIRILVKSIN